MENIVNISHNNTKRAFSVFQAREILPLVYKVTENHHNEVKKMINRLEAIKGVCSEKAEALEKQINFEINRWQDKVQKLGAVPKGLWLVDFDNGEGYYCWKFPENDIKYFHGYQDGFSGRVEIE